MNQEITAVVLVQNNEKTLARTLTSLSEFPILVIDGGSRDNSVKIAKNFNAEVVINPFSGFSTQRNFALDQVKTTWCLMIDSDEALTSELKTELIQLTLKKDAKPLYRIFRTEYLLGRENEDGYGRSDYQERFFQVSRIRYAGDLHEYPVVDGKKPELNSELVGNVDRSKRLLHNPENNFSMMIDRIAQYNKIKAQEKIGQGAKTSWLEILIIFHFSFWQIFLRRWKAGRIAFFEAMINAINRVLVKLLIYEAQLLENKKKFK